MTHRRRLVVFLLVLSALSPPFFSERPSQQERSLLLSDEPQFREQPHNQDIQRLLLTPTFFIHLSWIVGLLLLSMIAVLDVTLKLVYAGCTFGVNRITLASLPGNRPRYEFNTFPMGGARLTSCILHRLERIGIFIYGSGAVLYTELTHQSQGIDLYDAVSKKWSIPIHVQTLIHSGKRVNAVWTPQPIKELCMALMYS